MRWQTRGMIQMLHQRAELRPLGLIRPVRVFVAPLAGKGVLRGFVSQCGYSIGIKCIL